MIVPESTDLSWNWNSASLQTGEIRGSMDTKKLQIKRATVPQLVWIVKKTPNDCRKKSQIQWPSDKLVSFWFFLVEIKPLEGKRQLWSFLDFRFGLAAIMLDLQLSTRAAEP
jgi:hypothetical protein